MGPTRVCSFTARLQRAAPVIRTAPADLRAHTGIGKWELGNGPRSCVCSHRSLAACSSNNSLRSCRFAHANGNWEMGIGNWTPLSCPQARALLSRIACSHARALLSLVDSRPSSAQRSRSLCPYIPMFVSPGTGVLLS